MLEKLITNIKKSLSGMLGKKTDAAEEEINEGIEASMDSSDDENALNAEQGETQAEDKKKKQMSMIIRVVVILGLAYYALDEFVLKSPEPSLEQAQVKTPRKPKKIPPPQAEVAEKNELPTETPPAETPPAVTEAPMPEAQPPIENVNVLDKTESQAATLPPVEEAPPVVEQKPMEMAPEPKIDQSIDQLVEKVDQNVSNPTEVVNVPSQGQGREENKDSSMASKIVEEVTETAPPAYDQFGRGLVYNCKDRYWACLDKPSYVICNKNMKWNSSKGNPAECVIQAVYNSEEDCAKIQKYNVSTNKETSFCKN